MNTDELRRLLELAARACGIHPHYRFSWCPRTDDGDSARMRSALWISTIWSDTSVHCINSLGGAVESFADHNNDRNAALRLCTLKVAAMIGEGME